MGMDNSTTSSGSNAMVSLSHFRASVVATWIGDEDSMWIDVVVDLHSVGICADDAELFGKDDDGCFLVLWS